MILSLKPFAVGSIMAAVMLWMGHERIMAGDIALTYGVAVFVLTHVALVALAFLLTLLSPKVRRLFRQHRPSFPHVMIMLAGTAFMAGAIHLVFHGGLS